MNKNLKVLGIVSIMFFIGTFNIYAIENEENSEQIVKNIYKLKVEKQNILNKTLEIDKSIDNKREQKQEVDDIEIVQISFTENEENLKSNKDIIQESIENEIKKLEDSKVPLKEELQKLEEQESDLKSKISGKINRGSWPLPGYYRISSPYGYRIHPISKEKKFHKGVDIPAKFGTDVLATDYGVVSFSGVQNGYGNIVAIKHFDGKTSLYGHNSKNIVKEGELVYKGQPIAKVGSTGRSTGNHVHFEIIINGELKNPLDITDR